MTTLYDSDEIKAVLSDNANESTIEYQYKVIEVFKHIPKYFN